MRCLGFDDLRDRPSRREMDKLAPIRNDFEKFVKNAGEYITTDEKLEPFIRRCSFLQYIPSKPAKYGIKVFAVFDARTFCTSNLEIHAGTQPKRSCSSENGLDKVVKRFREPILNPGRNLTVYNWFTSYTLVKNHLEKKITLVGTIRKNKKELPIYFTCGRKREV
ncbi:uncharacterized protein LOC118204046 [Stegodyphus dumicola]|uniref:uncharacterized protein LOC118204046 n=1 Tax=Stegodyphus dumicola TaxID=202533 RepID=UPI0015AB631A|nr:uncharacterized protein LOC118204046 [Stegodyphus dumicola]